MKFRGFGNGRGSWFGVVSPGTVLAWTLGVAAVVGVVVRVEAKVPAEKLDQLPPAATHEVDFGKEIRPILESACIKCHGHGKAKGGFRLDTRETTLSESDSGRAVVPGRSRDSYLIHLVSGLDEENVMPEKGTKLTPAQVGLLRAWIDQGVKWDANVSFGKVPHRHLQPRQPELPGAESVVGSHPVDRLLAAYWARHGIPSTATGTGTGTVEDRVYARRVYLDVVGLLPTEAELKAFLEDRRPDRRERLVKQLLGDTQRYAQHWLSYWNDLLRNDYRGTGYIDGGREQITKWLYTALLANKPYDAFVRELVNPGDGPARGFVKGIVWRGAVNASQTPQLQAAQNIGQIFLGVNLKCASCHDSFIDDWQLTDAYGMAGVYADGKLELVQCDKPLGKHAPAKFVFQELGAIDDDAPKAKRIERLAELMVSPANGRLSRTIVNRLWGRLLGRGLVEPVDVMQNEAWDENLLDWLAEDLVAHRFDLKRTLELILTSRAYQLPTVPAGETEKNYVFRGPAVRRLSAEQFRDALGQLTGVWADKPEGGIDALLVDKAANSGDAPAAAYWVWSDPHGAEGVPPGTIYLRRTVELESAPTDALAVVNVDNSHRMWVNGREARRKNDIPWNETSVLDLRPFLKTGRNVIAIEAVNGGDGPNPAGLLFYARLRSGTKEAGNAKVFDLASDATWKVSTNKVAGWEKAEFDDGSWGAAKVLGPDGMAPWNVGPQFAATVRGKTVYGSVRAALVSADPLTLALGRPNREQVTSVRPSTATTLQMLELTNGGTLAGLLRQGAEKLLATGVEPTTAGNALVERVFVQGLGRKPTSGEAELSRSLVGEKPGREGVEDLLWSVAMLPEFQLIY